MNSIAAHADNTPANGQNSLENAQVRAQLRLREMVLSGELPGGARVTEVGIADKLGMSRTPVRAALMRLAQEGLMEALPSAGYAVRSFSESDVAEAIELRGTMEGMAARLAAERGAAPALVAQARETLAAIDALLLRPTLIDAAFSSYVHLNARFHTQLAALAGSGLLARELERVASLPFASPSAFVVHQANSPQARDMLVVAQDQHRQVLDAIVQREGARAEALMREHSRIAQRNLRDAVDAAGAEPIAGMRLIRKRG